MALVTQVRVVGAPEMISFTQTATEQTNDVQDINAANDSLMSIFAIMDGDVISNTPEDNINTNTNTNTNNNTNNNVNGSEEEGGAGGSLGINLLLSILMLYTFTRRFS